MMKDKRSDQEQATDFGQDAKNDERGSAIIIAIFIMALLVIFVAAALARITSETLVMGNDAAQSQSFGAAQASLETMTRNFNKIFETRLQPTAADINRVRTTLPPGFGNFNFDQDVVQTQNLRTVTLSEGPYAGLTSLQDAWRLTSTATGLTGVQVQLTRSFLNNRIPVFQFGAFYQNDMYFSPGGTMNVGGRVHTNGNLYLRGEDLHFQGRVTAARQIVHDVSPNGTGPFYVDNVWVTDGAGGEERVTEGSVIDGPDIAGTDPDRPDGTLNANWENFRRRFNDNLLAGAPPLVMPLQFSGNDPIEIIKRGRATDNIVLAAARYYNESCIRVTLDDRQARLPGGNGGRRLDGNDLGGLPSSGTARGYQPRDMNDGYRATRINGHRFYTGANYPSGTTTRETWIKVELVTRNDANPGSPTVVDITEDFLSLGMTERTDFTDALGNTVQAGDNRAIIKVQRYAIQGPPLRVTDIHDTGASTNNPSPRNDARIPADRPPGFGIPGYPDVGPVYTWFNNVNYVTNYNAYFDGLERAHEFPASAGTVRINGQDVKVIPFPIKMYDVREGLFHDSFGITSSGTTQSHMNNAWDGAYSIGGNNSNVPQRGVMSSIDIDVNNLRRFMNGMWNGQFPNGLTSASVPLDDRGLILYISDRRGDADNDGVYDMENIYAADINEVAATDSLQGGEDLSGVNAVDTVNLVRNNALEADYDWESCPYSDIDPSDIAAVTDSIHPHFRRAVRLINGAWLPGNANAGFTLATENGAYILGNYNATGAAAPVGSSPTPPSGYVNSAGPGSVSVPSSVAADAVTILSNVWNDGKSFRNPFGLNRDLPNNHGRGVPIALGGETTVRTALLMGASRNSLVTSPNQGGITGPGGGNTKNLDGGAQNFPRFLEWWNFTGQATNTRINYCGSMISLFNARVSNGSYKFGFLHVYSAPNRNWNFDTNFLNPTQLPPGTPFLQFVHLTGFRQTND